MTFFMGGMADRCGISTDASCSIASSGVGAIIPMESWALPVWRERLVGGTLCARALDPLGLPLPTMSNRYRVSVKY